MRCNKFETLDMALSFACNNLTISKNEWIGNNSIIKTRKSQSRISDYLVSPNRNIELLEIEDKELLNLVTSQSKILGIPNRARVVNSWETPIL